MITVTPCSLVRGADLTLIYRVLAVEDLRDRSTPCEDLPFGGGTYTQLTVEPLASIYPADHELPATMDVLSTSSRGQFEGTVHFSKLRLVEGHWVVQPGGIHVEQRASGADFTEDDAEQLAANRGVDWRLPFTLDGIQDVIDQAVSAGDCAYRHTEPRSAEQLAESYRSYGERECSDDPDDRPIEGTDGGEAEDDDDGDAQ